MKQIGESFCFTLFVVLITASQATATSRHTLDYYGQEVRDRVVSTDDSSSLKDLLFKVLASAHIKKDGEPDEIVDHCLNSQPDLAVAAASSVTLQPATVFSQLMTDNLTVAKASATCFRHRTFSYTETRKFLLGRLHLEGGPGNYAITTVYCQKRLSKKDFPHGHAPGPNKIPDILIVNTEHTWPQSHFSSKFPREMQKTDLHILFPSLAQANSLRGNLPFAEVIPHSRPCALAARGHAVSTDNGDYFEPPDVHKGNVARALFYFATRYKMKISKTEEDYLRKWNALDPVDEFESQRNELIFERQQVRNPFIDHPWMADEIADF